MKNNAPALTAGISQLRDGSMRLSDGLSQFSKQGIEKLVHATKDTENLIPRLKAILDVSKNYKSFAGISENSDGNVKFVYKTAEIK
jgi:putative membrane protein